MEFLIFQLMSIRFNVEDIPLERQDEQFCSEDILIKRFTLKHGEG